MPAAPNTSQINQQYYIRLKTDESLKDWRRGYNEFRLSEACTSLLFAIDIKDICDTLNPALWKKNTIDHNFPNALPSSVQLVLSSRGVSPSDMRLLLCDFVMMY